MGKWGIAILGGLGAVLFGSVLLTGVLMAGESGGAFGGEPPETVARRVNEAFARKDLAAAEDLTCPERRGPYRDGSMLQGLAIGSREPIDVRYEPLGVEGSIARVRETGAVKVTALGFTVTSVVDNVMSFRREGGRWCYLPPESEKGKSPA